MLSAVCVGTNDLEAAGAFYDEVLATIGMTRVLTVPGELGYAGPDGHKSFFVLLPYDKNAATFGNGVQVTFVAADQDAVRAFHSEALRLGGTDEGKPGPRDYYDGYYGAYVRDLDGNKLHVAVEIDMTGPRLG